MLNCRNVQAHATSFKWGFHFLPRNLCEPIDQYIHHKGKALSFETAV